MQQPQTLEPTPLPTPNPMITPPPNQAAITSSSPSSSGGSISGSSSSGSSNSKGSTSINSKADIKQTVIDCISGNLSDAIIQATSKGAVVLNVDKATNTPTASLRNMTLIDQLSNSTSKCVPGLRSHILTATQHHTVATTTTLGTMMPPFTSAVNHTKTTQLKDYLLGYKFGKQDATVGVFDIAGSCGQPQHVVNQTSCAAGYTQSYNANCGPPKTKYSCN